MGREGGGWGKKLKLKKRKSAKREIEINRIHRKREKKISLKLNPRYFIIIISFFFFLCEIISIHSTLLISQITQSIFALKVNLEKRKPRKKGGMRAYGIIFHNLTSYFHTQQHRKPVCNILYIRRKKEEMKIARLEMTKK